MFTPPPLLNAIEKHKLPEIQINTCTSYLVDTSARMGDLQSDALKSLSDNIHTSIIFTSGPRTFKPIFDLDLVMTLG